MSGKIFLDKFLNWMINYFTEFIHLSQAHIPNPSQTTTASAPQRRLEFIKWADDDKYERLNEEVVSLINSGQSCGLFIGAGLSKGIYPDTEELVDSFISIFKLDISKDEMDNKCKHASKILEKCLQKSSKIYFNELRKAYDPKKADKAQFALLDLYDIGIAQGSFVSTNIDPCLLKAAKRKGGIRAYYYYPISLNTLEFLNKNIYHIHGVVVNEKGRDCIKDTVMTESQYKVAYSSDGPSARFLMEILDNSSIIFFGFSLQDQPIRQILKSIKENRDNNKKKALEYGETLYDRCHYAYLPAKRNRDDASSDEVKNERSRELREEEDLLSLNVKVIRFAVIDSDYQQLENIINNLAIKTSRTRMGG